MQSNPQPLPPAFQSNQPNHQKPPVQNNQNIILMIAVFMAGAQFIPSALSTLSSLFYFDFYGSMVIRLFLNMMYLSVLAVPILLVFKMSHSNLRTLAIIIAAINLLMGLFNTFYYFGDFF